MCVLTSWCRLIMSLTTSKVNWTFRWRRFLREIFESGEYTNVTHFKGWPIQGKLEKRKLPSPCQPVLFYIWASTARAVSYFRVFPVHTFRVDVCFWLLFFMLLNNPHVQLSSYCSQLIRQPEQRPHDRHKSPFHIHPRRQMVGVTWWSRDGHMSFLEYIVATALNPRTNIVGETDQYNGTETFENRELWQRCIYAMSNASAALWK